MKRRNNPGVLKTRKTPFHIENQTFRGEILVSNCKDRRRKSFYPRTHFPMIQTVEFNSLIYHSCNCVNLLNPGDWHLNIQLLFNPNPAFYNRVSKQFRAFSDHIFTDVTYEVNLCLLTLIVSLLPNHGSPENILADGQKDYKRGDN